MVKNYEPEEAFNLIVRDFIRAWECLADKKRQRKSQGPLFFGFLAMNLLEYICRLCATNRADLLDFSNNLCAINKSYFIHLSLPNLKAERGRGDDVFYLPYINEKHMNGLLLTLLFDTIRNGLGHLYQPTVVTLKERKQLYIVLKNASGKIPCLSVDGINPRSNHLCYSFDHEGNMRIFVYPEYLMCNFKEAAEKSNLFSKGLFVKPFSRDSRKVDIKKLEKRFERGGGDRCYSRIGHITHS